MKLPSTAGMTPEEEMALADKLLAEIGLDAGDAPMRRDSDFASLDVGGQLGALVAAQGDDAEVVPQPPLSVPIPPEELIVDSVTRREGLFLLCRVAEENGRLALFHQDDVDEDVDGWMWGYEDRAVEATVYAGSWLEAKSQLGFALSKLQTAMVERRASHYSITLHTYGSRDRTARQLAKGR